MDIKKFALIIKAETTTRQQETKEFCKACYAPYADKFVTKDSRPDDYAMYSLEDILAASKSEISRLYKILKKRDTLSEEWNSVLKEKATIHFNYCKEPESRNKLKDFLYNPSRLQLQRALDYYVLNGVLFGTDGYASMTSDYILPPTNNTKGGNLEDVHQGIVCLKESMKEWSYNEFTDWLKPQLQRLEEDYKNTDLYQAYIKIKGDEGYIIPVDYVTFFINSSKANVADIVRYIRYYRIRYTLLGLWIEVTNNSDMETILYGIDQKSALPLDVFECNVPDEENEDIINYNSIIYDPSFPFGMVRGKFKDDGGEYESMYFKLSTN